MKNLIPIVYIHKGDANYLKMSINSALKNGFEVHLIGDENNKNYFQNHINIDTLKSEKFDEFQKVYKHLSSNDKTFELVCFERYFRLLEFMEKKNFEKIIMLDSDVLLFSNLENYHFEDYDVAFSVHERQSKYRWSICPHCCFWSKKALENFVDFILDTYKNNINILQEKYDFHVSNKIKGGICDMTLLYLWNEQGIFKVLNTAKEFDFQTMDNCISSKENFVDDEYKYNKFLKLKKVVFKNDIPYFINKENELVQANLLHFQGTGKALMQHFYNYNKRKIFTTRLKIYARKGMEYASKTFKI